MACALNLIEPIHYFTKNGIDYEKSHGPFNKTALHIAVEYGNVIVIKYLLNNGADIQACDEFGFNVYEKAEYRGYYDFKPIFDHFKNQSKLKKANFASESKEISENTIRKITKPSDFLEMVIYNDIKLQKIEDPWKTRFDLNKFGLSCFHDLRMNL